MTAQTRREGLRKARARFAGGRQVAAGVFRFQGNLAHRAARRGDTRLNTPDTGRGGRFILQEIILQD
ncbi:MAG: hypothetical protein ABSC48_17160 [Terracidiphilus sp.]